MIKLLKDARGVTMTEYALIAAPPSDLVEKCAAMCAQASAPSNPLFWTYLKDAERQPYLSAALAIIRLAQAAQAKEFAEWATREARGDRQAFMYLRDVAAHARSLMEKADG